MRFRIWAAVLGVATAMVAVPAAAQMRMPGMSGFYLGATVGQSKAKDWCSGLGGTGISCDDSDTAWKLFGGYQINRNFAAELGYAKLGKFKASLGALTDEAKVSAWDLSLLGSWPVADRFSVFGRLGVYQAHAKEEFSFADSVEHDNNDLTYGFGVRYDFTRNFGVRAEWQRYADVGGGDVALGADVGQKSNIDVLGISALWVF
jgi:OOP family OmpA-OmpF porin